MLPSYSDVVRRDPERGTGTSVVVLTITFVMIAFVAALTIAVYMTSPAPGTVPDTRMSVFQCLVLSPA
jgi:hypothetical protein